MSASEPSAAGDATFYTYRPSLLGAPWQFKLVDDCLEWSVGRRSGRMLLRDVNRVRMSFKLGNMQPQCFRTELWAAGAPKLEIASTSWKSMVEQERLDHSYSAFVAELHRRLARAAAPARYEQGTMPFKYWVGFALFAAIMLGLAALLVRGLQANALGGAVFIAAFLALFAWQGGKYFSRNRPGIYRPDAPPPALLPKG